MLTTEMLPSLVKKLRSKGMGGLLRSVSHRLLPPKLRDWRAYATLVRGRTGLEIGGPSSIFSRRGLIPLYPFVGTLDNCNFNGETIWHGAVGAGLNFQFDRYRQPGRQFICEGEDLGSLAGSSYDFVLSSHNLEHLANPLRALRTWMGVLKDGGHLVLVLPHKDGTFDHRRLVTTLAHLVEDFERETTEHDLTHLEEILALHDLERDPAAGDFDEFVRRSQKNYENRCLHHHVFDTALAVQLVDHMHFQIERVDVALPYNIVVIGRKVPDSEPVDNRQFMGSQAHYRGYSPFPTDRIGH